MCTRLFAAVLLVAGFVCRANALTITSPVHNGSWVAGSTGTITWNPGSTAASPSVSLWYSADGGQNFNIPLALHTPNDGSQSFAIPNTPTQNGRIRIETNDSIPIVATGTSNIGILGAPGAVATPVISPGSRFFSVGVNVTLSCATQGAVIYYTTNGNVPRPGTTFTRIYVGAFGVFSTTTVRALAMRQGFVNSAVAVAQFSLVAPSAITPAPVISPAAGVYSGPQTISLSSPAPGALIYYTTNGNVPVPGSSFTMLYSGPFFIPGSTTIRAIAKSAGAANSAVSVGAYTITNPLRAAIPVISPGTQIISAPASVSISSATAGAAIHYTTNGNEPQPGTTFTFLYTGPFTVSATTTIRAMASGSGMVNSPVAVSVLTMQTTQPAATPVIAPGSGTFSAPQMVSITTSTPGATVYYTISGNVPRLGTVFTRVYTGPFEVSGNTTVRAIAIAPGMVQSGVAVSFINVVNLGGTGGRQAVDPDMAAGTGSSLSVFPNPARDRISVAGLSETAELRVFNSLGKEVYRVVPQVSGKAEVDISSWDPGMYFVRSGESACMHRFVKR